ncbi:MAG TPA: hypothetical protein VF576_03055 [Rubricoccaceae bacterium]|jgi:hypothetical protein
MLQHLRRLPDDLHGLARLATDATVGTADLVEALHAQIARRPGSPRWDRRRGISGLVYRAVRAVARLSGRSAEAALLPVARLVRDAQDAPTPAAREALVAVLNGVLGDGLAATDNPLAIPMRLRRDGRALDLTPAGLAAALPHATPHVLVLAHGLCMSDLQWERDGHDHGAALERDVGLTAVHLHYNTGQHVSTNGREFAALLEALVDAWPVPVRSLSLLCHSMGGLVARSACLAADEAGLAWPRRLRRIVFLGTPHHGSPVERRGNGLERWLLRTPYTAPFARVGRLRSAGITDLRYGLLRDEDWRWRDRFEPRPDRRRPAPLPEGVEAFAMAATTGRTRGSALDRLVGDGLVPVESATGHHDVPEHALAFAAERLHVAVGRHHFDLLGPDVYPTLKGWLDPSVEAGRRG